MICRKINHLQLDGPEPTIDEFINYLEDGLRHYSDAELSEAIEWYNNKFNDDFKDYLPYYLESMDKKDQAVELLIDCVTHGKDYLQMLEHIFKSDAEAIFIERHLV
ncbi:hypothetical protein [Macrococcus animalis]|uniref:hypothetical protein n=1 Tax=Macrococcus animalis TaxID=3395467 RepID=UPI0039BDCA6F